MRKRGAGLTHKIERIDALDLTRLTMSGFVNCEGLVLALRALPDSPRFNYRTLLVYELDTEVDLTAADLREIASVSRTERPGDAPYGRTAVVAPKDLLFGLTRMYEVFNDGTAADICVFRDIDEAVEWLQLGPPGTEPDGTTGGA